MLNLYDIYKKVADRHRRQERNGVTESTLQKSLMMKTAAKAILEKPTLKRVKEFEKAETLWWSCSDVPEYSKFISIDFEDAIRSKNFINTPPAINRAHNGWVAEEGVVYCISSPSRNGQVKIGATTMDLCQRLRKLKNRYKYSTINIEFAYKTNQVSILEGNAQDYLREFLVSGKTKQDSVEWFYVTPKKANLAIKKVANLNNISIEKLKIDKKIII